MVSIKPISINFSEGGIKFGNFESSNSIQISIIGTTRINKITAVWNGKSIEFIDPVINFGEQKKTQLLSILTFIGKKNLKIRIPGDPSIDELQSTLNAFVISYAVIICYNKFSENSEFNNALENPFLSEADANPEKILYKLRFMKKNQDKFILRPIVPTIKSFLEIFSVPKWDTLQFIKDQLSQLAKFYEWKNLEIFEKVIKIKKDFFNSTNLHQKLINKGIISIKIDVDTFRSYTLKLGNLNFSKNYNDIKNGVVSLDASITLTNKEDPPINYPRHHQLDLYDDLVVFLEKGLVEQISIIKKSLVSEDEQKDVKLAIQRAETDANLQKNSLRALIKKIISNFDTLGNMDFNNHPELGDLGFHRTVKKLANKLWYYHKNITNYQESLYNIQEIYECSNNLISIVSPAYPYLTFYNLSTKIHRNFELYKLKITEHNRVLKAYDHYTQKFLDYIIRLKSETIIQEDHESTALEVIDWQTLVINEEQREHLLGSLKEIMGVMDGDRFFEAEKNILSEDRSKEIEDILIKEEVKEEDDVKEIINESEVNNINQIIETSDTIKNLIDPNVYDNQQLTNIILKLMIEMQNLTSRVNKLEK